MLAISSSSSRELRWIANAFFVFLGLVNNHPHRDLLLLVKRHDLAFSLKNFQDPLANPATKVAAVDNLNNLLGRVNVAVNQLRVNAQRKVYHERYVLHVNRLEAVDIGIVHSRKDVWQFDDAVVHYQHQRLRFRACSLRLGEDACERSTLAELGFGLEDVVRSVFKQLAKHNQPAGLLGDEFHATVAHYPKLNRIVVDGELRHYSNDATPLLSSLQRFLPRLQTGPEHVARSNHRAYTEMVRLRLANHFALYKVGRVGQISAPLLRHYSDLRYIAQTR